MLQASAIQEQLERMLATETFATAGRHSRLLRYLVERTLAGEGDQLKEYVLGTEVFDRRDSYDPRLDSIVRVEVRRLRSRLEDYYRGPGEADSIVITIPRGSYVPVFEERSVAASVPAPRGEASSVLNPRRGVSPATIVAAALSLAIVTVAASVALNTTRSGASAASGPAIAVLPFESYTPADRDARVVAHLTDVVTTELAKLGTVSVASRTSAAQYVAGGRPIPEIARALDVDFLVEASVDIRGNTLHVAARLVDGRLDRKVWVGEYDLDPSGLTDTARVLARDAAAAALSRTP
jgi:TolB-like protein